MFKIIFILFAAIAVLFTGIIALQPSEFQVSRSAIIHAPNLAVFDQVNDLHNFHAWSPWSERDPAAKLTFEGPAVGTGSSYHWLGNQDVGEGSLTITESNPSDRIRMKLEFLKPFQSSNNVEFIFQPDDEQTLVTWSLFGKNDFVGKAFSLLMNMDGMIGKDFETGLANLEKRLNPQT
jgi:hypothetical protein